MSPDPSFAAALALASVHLFSERLRVLHEIPRSRLLSIAGGMSVAYVVLRILPGIAESQEAGGQALLLFSLAMMLKLVVNDHGLYADHKEAYNRVGRWVLVAAVLAGWAAGYAGGVPETGLALLQAFVAGSILLNVLKEELPEERESRYWAFAAGAAAYAALLLAL